MTAAAGRAALRAATGAGAGTSPSTALALAGDASFVYALERPVARVLVRDQGCQTEASVPRIDRDAAQTPSRIPTIKVSSLQPSLRVHVSMVFWHVWPVRSSSSGVTNFGGGPWLMLG